MRARLDFCELPRDARLIPDMDDKYYADTLGNIYCKYKNSGYIKLHTKIDKNNGYVYCNGSLKVHRLVALAFIPNPENKPQVNHKDGNKQNNSVSNLEWATQSENMLHAYRTGLTDKRKLSDAHKKTIKVIFNDNTELIFNSRKECADYLKTDSGDLSNYILGKKKMPKRCNVKEIFYLKGVPYNGR